MGKIVVGLLVLLLSISSCSKDSSKAENIAVDLIGSWSSSNDQAEGKIVSTYTFNDNSTYLFRTDWFGFNGEPKTKLTEFSENSGAFEVERDSLFLGSFSSRYWIKEDVLYLEYITYPADAPVLTQMKYNRIDVPE
ncbi:MAG: hypothetical protein ACTHOM_15400 [Allomuricauda sp.]